jgi:hypothetical protein
MIDRILGQTADVARQRVCRVNTRAFRQTAYFIEQMRAVAIEHRLVQQRAPAQLSTRNLMPSAHHVDVLTDLVHCLLAMLSAEFPVRTAREN